MENTALGKEQEQALVLPVNGWESAKLFIQKYNSRYTDLISLQSSFGERSLGFGIVHTAKNSGIIYELFAVLLLCMLLKVYAESDLRTLFFACFSTRGFNQLARDNTLFASGSLIPIIVFSTTVFCYALRLYIPAIGNAVGIHGILLVAVLLMFLLVYSAVKTGVLYLLSLVYSLKKMLQDFLLILYINTTVLSFILLPFLFGYELISSEYAETMLYIGRFLLVIGVLYTYFRAFAFEFSNFQFSKKYFILYLCVLEICPVVIFYRLLF